MPDHGTSDSSGDVNRRRFLKATSGAAAAVALAGCSGGESTPSPTATPTESSGTDTGSSSTPTEGNEPQTGGTLQLWFSYAFDTLDPHESIYANVQEVTGQMFDTPFQDIHGHLNLQPHLVTEYEVSSDGKTYTFSLKEGATFHDGSDLTAADLVYTFERIAAGKNSVNASEVFGKLGVVHETETVDGEEQYKPGTMAVTAVDDYTLEMKLESANYLALDLLSQELPYATLPEGLVDDVPNYDGQMTQSEFTSNPIGSGAFKFSAREKGTMLEMEAFDDYHGQKAYVDGIHYQIITKSNSLFTYGQNKNADHVLIPNSQYDPQKVSVEKEDDLGRKIGTYGPMRNEETVNYMSVTGLGNTFAVFNTQKIDRRIRQAIAYTFNASLVTQQFYKNRAKPASHIVPPGAFPGGPKGYESHGEKYPYGVSKSMTGKAKSLVEEAGYSTDNPKEMQFSVWQSTAAEQMANLLSDQLKPIGINLSVKVAPAGQYWGRASKGNFDMYLSGWAMSIPDASTMLDILYPPNNVIDPSGLEYSGWSDTEWAKQAKNAWEKAQANLKPTEEDAQVRNNAWLAMEEANWKDLAMMPILHGNNEWFWYDWFHSPLMGPPGRYKLRYNYAWLEERS